jgi:hypothetical protein
MKEEYVKESSNVGLVVRSNSDPKYDSDVEGSFTDTYSKSVHDQVREHEEGFECCQVLPFIDMHDSTTQKIVSFFIGILHGVAGPGAILGIYFYIFIYVYIYVYFFMYTYIYMCNFRSITCGGNAIVEGQYLLFR